VPEYCTCGAELPPDARFCHKCGKPQREEPKLLDEELIHKEVEPQIEAPPAPPISPPEINFHNRLAVRTGFLAGTLAFLLSLAPVPFIGRVILLAGAGFFSVYLYRRRSGHALSVRNGARLGWISGLLCFVIITVLFTINFALISFISQQGGVAAFYRSQLGAMGVPEQSIKEVIQTFQSPLRVTGLLFSLFVMFTGLLAAGGALGAKFLRRA
jgi:hypothetical protein